MPAVACSCPRRRRRTTPNHPRVNAVLARHHTILSMALRSEVKGAGKYNYNAAPCVCCEGNNQTAAGPGISTCGQGSNARNWLGKETGIDRRRQRLGSGLCEAFPGSGCSQKCLEAQVNKGHDAARTSPATPIPRSGRRHNATCTTSRSGGPLPDGICGDTNPGKIL